MLGRLWSNEENNKTSQLIQKHTAMKKIKNTDSTPEMIWFIHTLKLMNKKQP